jgi:hypothetical protein
MTKQMTGIVILVLSAQVWAGQAVFGSASSEVRVEVTCSRPDDFAKL